VTRTASASWFIPLSSARRACSSKAIIFGIWGLPFASLALSSVEC
jgi:hypothetical protein